MQRVQPRTICQKVRTHAKKARWYGRIIDSEGYQLDLGNMEAIKTMTEPINIAELCQFILYFWWMRADITDMHTKNKPLNEILEKAFKITGERKKSALKKVLRHQLSWGAVQFKALVSIKDGLRQSVKFAFPKNDRQYGCSQMRRKSSGQVLLRKQVKISYNKRCKIRSTNRWLSSEKSL